MKMPHKPKTEEQRDAYRERARLKWAIDDDYRKKKQEENKKWMIDNRSKAIHINTRYRLKKYGLTVADFNKMSIDQNGRCALCKNLPKNTLVVDHDHKTGRVRGLLCEGCNLALGFFETRLKSSFTLIYLYLNSIKSPSFPDIFFETRNML